MTEDQFEQKIKDYLHENLSVNIDVGRDYDWYGYRVEVKVYLGDELVTSSSDGLPYEDE